MNHTLISLWDLMKLLKADRLIGLVHGLVTSSMFSTNDNATLDHGWRQVIRKSFVDLLDECDSLNLYVAGEQIKTAIKLLDGQPLPGESGNISRYCNLVCTTITTELKLRVFFTVPPERAKFLEGLALFGDAVDQAFPSASDEIAEAGKCMALGRYSACVFHLMRTTEAGLRCLANALSVPFGHDTWNLVLDQIEKSIRAMNSTTHGPDWKVDEQFYSEAAAHFRVLKNAWRNYSMHLRDTYTEERATDIYNSVGAFMRHLATKLHE